MHYNLIPHLTEMMKCCTVACFFLQLIIPTFLFGQSIDKHKDIVDGEAFDYYVMQPKLEVSGILLLLPGTGEKPKTIFDRTSLPEIMVKKGFIIVVPELRNSLFANQRTINRLNKICKTISQKNNLSNLVIGGFSSGGAIAIGYAEHLLSIDTKNVLKGVFAIDPPLDLTRLYASSERKINYECQGLIKKEGYSIKRQLEKSLGGVT